MALACKWCIVSTGLKGSDIGKPGVTFVNQEELTNHLESFHHCPVQRDGETMKQAEARFLAAHPQALACPECVGNKAPWIKGR